jgi:hypothetical protein
MKPKKREKFDRKEMTLEAVKLLLAERGHVVIGIKPGRESNYEVGDIVREVATFDLGQPFMIVAHTDAQEWLEQGRFLADRFPHVFSVTPEGKRMALEGGPYYRVVTD